MGIVKKISMIGLAGITALALTMPSAEARSGRKGALIARPRAHVATRIGVG
jgi:hypothetical protein